LELKVRRIGSAVGRIVAVLVPVGVSASVDVAVTEGVSVPAGVGVSEGMTGVSEAVGVGESGIAVGVEVSVGVSVGVSVAGSCNAGTEKGNENWPNNRLATTMTLANSFMAIFPFQEVFCRICLGLMLFGVGFPQVMIE
jgi:hypothetical protein